MPRKNKKKAKRKKAKKRSGGYNRGGGFRVTGSQNNPNHRGGYRGGQNNYHNNGGYNNYDIRRGGSGGRGGRRNYDNNNRSVRNSNKTAPKTDFDIFQDQLEQLYYLSKPASKSSGETKQDDTQ